MVNVRLMPRTTVYGAYDHGIYGALERITDHLQPTDAIPRQILWKVYSKQTILCAGATERPIAFGNNDRPGIMLAGAVRTYVNRWGVMPGKRVAVFTNNDDGWRTAVDLATKGVEITAVIDSRTGTPPAELPGTAIVMGGRIVDTKGRHRISSLVLTNGQTISVDCLAVSGGWNPNVYLTCHHGGRPIWREDIAAFAPGEAIPGGMTVAGAANGSLTLASALKDGHKAGNIAAKALG